MSTNRVSFENMTWTSEDISSVGVTVGWDNKGFLYSKSSKVKFFLAASLALPH